MTRLRLLAAALFLLLGGAMVQALRQIDAEEAWLRKHDPAHAMSVGAPFCSANAGAAGVLAIAVILRLIPFERWSNQRKRG